MVTPGASARPVSLYQVETRRRPGYRQINQHGNVGWQQGDLAEILCREADAGFLSPDPEYLGPSMAIPSRGHQMASWSKVTVDHRMRRQEPLRLFG